MPLRIVFCGTPEFAVPSLRRLLADPEFAVAAVVTQPDRPRGRGQEVSASPVKQVAAGSGRRRCTSRKRSRRMHRWISSHAWHAMPWSSSPTDRLFPARLIAIPRLGWINLHGSLLPKYRGAAPIAWAIANGETVTGLTTMQIDAGMDTGPMLLRRELEIGPDETAPELATADGRRRSPADGRDAAANSRAAKSRPIPQDSSQATYAPLLQKETWANRLVPSCPANLQPHARFLALAGRLQHIPRAGLPALG